jgi:hypothetical protein
MMLSEEAEQNIANIPLLDDSMRRRMNDTSSNIEENVSKA